MICYGAASVAVNKGLGRQLSFTRVTSISASQCISMHKSIHAHSYLTELDISTYL